MPRDAGNRLLNAKEQNKVPECTQMLVEHPSTGLVYRLPLEWVS